MNISRNIMAELAMTRMSCACCRKPLVTGVEAAFCWKSIVLLA
jgi:RNase P subunit RPR2